MQLRYVLIVNFPRSLCDEGADGAMRENPVKLKNNTQFEKKVKKRSYAKKFVQRSVKSVRSCSTERRYYIFTENASNEK